MPFVHTAIELTVGYISLFIVTKLLGKMTITQITLFDFISALVLGDLVGNALYNEHIKIKEIIFTVFFWGFLVYIVQFITQKSFRLRTLLEGRPSIVIHEGKICYNELKKNRLDLSQLQHMLRAKDSFSVSEVEYAILETDGSLSILKKSDYAAPTKSDHNMPNQPPNLPVTLISDGRLIRENLQRSGMNETWLQQELDKQGIRKYSEVLLAEWKKKKSTLYVQKY
ncbi:MULTISPECIES: DUF421 domain-containing protein [Bacillaceae]|jgi:uncharacterized membrane protein YcaP (DUF421 family)|uniref:DUF421 domain-containing protein n=1 Tax=Bacillaceae TaxID=186817 RepID=UPI00101C1390|nr:DUF421 domain-containing protein [Ectobacillus funiculus]